MAQSSELETLDQLLGGALSLTIIRRFYDSDTSFTQGVLRLLQSGDVRLLTSFGDEVPKWQWRSLFEDAEVLADLGSFMLDVTDAGAAKIS